MTDFTNINYLKTGNDRQKKAYQILKQLEIFEKLELHSPILTGTIPIDIDLPDSDLDIICTCKNHREFSEKLISFFAKQDKFQINQTQLDGQACTVATFKYAGFTIEIFAQNIPTIKQNAYRHMLIENYILKTKGNAFKAEIRQLKSHGYKTEPAFAKLLNLQGNPYIELLKLAHV